MFQRYHLLLLLFLIGCTAVAEPTIPPTPTAIIIPTSELKERTLRLFWWQAPKVINPHLTSLTADRDGARLVFEPLATFNAADELTPVLAAEIPSFENGLLDPDLKWVQWKLKEGVEWSDGRPFTAHDVKFTYDFINNRKAATASTYNAIESVEVLDLHTVQVNFKDTNPAWAQPFVGAEGMILPGHIFSAAEEPENIWAVGTGPYQLVSANTEEVLLLGSELVTTVKFIYEANPRYRGLEDLYFKRVELEGGGTAVEAASSVLESEISNVDFAYNLQLDGAELAAMVEAGQGIGRLESEIGGRVEFIAMTQTDPNDTAVPHPLLSIEADESNALVLQAIAHAIDKEAIGALYGPTGKVANAILMAPVNYHSEQEFFEYDLDKARELLATAGWVDENGDGVVEKDGRELSLTFRTTSNALRQATQTIIQQSLAQIGIDVKIDVSGQFLSTTTGIPASVYASTADMQMFTLGNQTPDPTSYMQEWTCGRIPQESDGRWSGFNVARWCNEQYDALHTQARVETDAAAREQLFKQMSDTLVENVIAIPLISRARVSGVSNEIVGVQLSPWDSHLWNVHEWRREP